MMIPELRVPQTEADRLIGETLALPELQTGNPLSVVLGYGAPDQPCPTCGGQRCPVSILPDGCAFYFNHPDSHLTPRETKWGYDTKCPACHNAGRVPVEFPFTAAITVPCRWCEGDGLDRDPDEVTEFYPQQPCTECEGKGHRPSGFVCTVTRIERHAFGEVLQHRGWRWFLEDVRPT
jgi:hypothetical protein